jgi:hypothetical protein
VEAFSHQSGNAQGNGNDDAKEHSKIRLHVFAYLSDVSLDVIDVGANVRHI